MLKHTIFKPSSLNLSSIAKCLLDKHWTWEELKDKAFPDEAKPPFIILGKDYFIAYPKYGWQTVNAKQEDGQKCDYRWRNYVMSKIQYGDYDFERGDYDGKLIKQNGLWTYKKIPITWFVHSSVNPMSLYGNGTFANSVVEYFDELELDKFASIVKNGGASKASFVVVKEDFSEMTGHDVEDITKFYRFNSGIMYNIVPKLAEDASYIDIFKENDKRIREIKANFKLVTTDKPRGSTGVLIRDNEEFYIKYFKDIGYEVDLTDKEYGHGAFGDNGYWNGPTYKIKTIEGKRYIYYSTSDGDKIVRRYVSEEDTLTANPEPLTLVEIDGLDTVYALGLGSMFVSFEFVKCSVGIANYAEADGVYQGDRIQFVLKDGFEEEKANNAFSQEWNFICPLGYAGRVIVNEHHITIEDGIYYEGTKIHGHRDEIEEICGMKLEKSCEHVYFLSKDDMVLCGNGRKLYLGNDNPFLFSLDFTP